MGWLIDLSPQSTIYGSSEDNELGEITVVLQSGIITGSCDAASSAGYGFQSRQRAHEKASKSRDVRYSVGYI